MFCLNKSFLYVPFKFIPNLICSESKYILPRCARYIEFSVGKYIELPSGNISTYIPLAAGALLFLAWKSNQNKLLLVYKLKLEVVYAYNVALFENFVFAWYAMDNHIIYGNARTRRKSADFLF